MIAADASSFRRYTAGERGVDVDRIDEALRSDSLVLPPVVVTELVSDPREDEAVVETLVKIPLIELKTSCFARAGLLRANLLRHGIKLPVEKCLVAQSCIDHDIPLVAHDRDFRHFVKAGLKLL